MSQPQQAPQIKVKVKQGDMKLSDTVPPQNRTCPPGALPDPIVQLVVHTTILSHHSHSMALGHLSQAIATNIVTCTPTIPCNSLCTDPHKAHLRYIRCTTTLPQGNTTATNLYDSTGYSPPPNQHASSHDNMPQQTQSPQQLRPQALP
ncbi:hypothetical protein SARC_11989 [Sphaeroforma arctica JP610]|uniref:Uncharacterized protein n=1 Tax=Sphaeroforma arctica JP610 TaxID=667725 RepID=A0A0L0FFC9_9EUKA|nr:hypothetical protein SARC_11989 [Sphaeroforma arctica JP610]KNC75487.1 hypothetical protein SARC_11989 [Sphaeroforma arctica JP610]|eukprot:XP_014149389.1 hypothetical protein SARC_11989 [Sphaeroforma arctica JP610]